ncbi:P-loop containing nucleoside triphosphate hydrolase protein [Pisolithus microcarpus]|nr:P-loop containing nucleoside triphosphate hydrolase protein [Pisolithus microcarpus]
MGGSHSHEPDWAAIERAQREQRELQEAQERQRQAEEAARWAREAAERAAREAEEQRQREHEAQLAAERAAQAARAEAERMRRQKEETERAERRAREEAEARAREERARAERIAREMEEERRRQEAGRLAAVAAREEEARRLRAIEEETRRAKRAQEEEERKAREAAEAARKAQAEREDVERQLKKGIQPVVMPTVQEIRLAKAKVQYEDAIFHFAVAGIAGSGKSSLINALCGMNNNDPNAAATGVNETTLTISRYVDTAHGEQFAWYDVPGSGTLTIPDWQYFNSQGLYVFDCILVLFNNRFTMTDQAILANCHRFQIPTFIVRSKSDQHIFNLMKDMGYDPDEEDADNREQFYRVAREQYVSETRQSVKNNLAEANLPDQRVYIVSNKTLFGAVKDKGPKRMIDEVELLTDLYCEAYRSNKFA